MIIPHCPMCGKLVEETALFCSNCGASLTQQPQTGQSAVPPYGPSRRFTFRQGGAYRERLREIIDKFRKKGATCPEKAMTAEELGLPTRFKGAMQKRLGQTGIFVEINEKYYLDEKRLEERRKQIGSRRRFKSS